MKKIFYKAASLVLSSSLVFTGLSLTGASTAFAEDNPETTTSDSNHSVSSEEAIYANIESINIKEEDNDVATLEVKLDKNIEDTDMPLFVYEENDPTALEEISEGGNVLEFDVQKTDSARNIYVTTGTSTSNTLIVGEKIEEVGTFELTTDKYILETDEYRPMLTWETFDIDNEFLPLYIADSDGNIVHQGDSYRYNSWSIDFFYDRPQMEYTAYIADRADNIKTINDLTQLVL